MTIKTEEYVFEGLVRPDVSIDRRLAALEAAESVSFPDSYRRLATALDGRRPVKNTIMVENGRGTADALTVRTFLTLCAPGDTADEELQEFLLAYGLNDCLDTAKEVAPGCVPFACDLDESLFCFDFSEKGEAVPIAYLMSGERMAKYRLCDNFEEFLKILDETGTTFSRS